MTAMRNVFFVLLTLIFSVTASAGVQGTPDEAVAMVSKAVSYMKANGRDKGFAEFNNPHGRFVDRDLYIFVLDQQGVMVAHGALPKIIGKRVLEMRDADDKYLFKNMLAATGTRTTAWVHYKWPNPATGEIAAKSTYLERVGDLVIGCGTYDKISAQAVAKLD